MIASAMNLLLVEHNPEDADLLRVMLDKAVSLPFNVTHVVSLDDAELYLAQNAVDLILLDLDLAGADRVNAIRRTHAAAPGASLVVLTGSENELLGVQASQEGAQDYLVKGQIEARELLRTLRYAVERRNIEQQLGVANDHAEAAQTLLHDAVQSMSEGFVIYDREDRFVLCNEACRQHYRGSADLLAPGTSFEDILQGGAKGDSRDGEVEWRSERLRLHREATGTIELRSRNGSWLLISDRRMQNGGIAGLRVDITALKQAQAALRESEARLDRAQAIAGIGSWELDLITGRYLWSRQLYFICGLSPQEFEPTRDNIATYVHPDDCASVQLWLSDLIAGREADLHEIRITCPDGEIRLGRIEGRAVSGTDGLIRKLAGTFQDITERRLIERQLAQAQKMEAIGKLTGGLAHDFNNGLAVITGNLDLLARLVKADPTAAELCDDARQGARRCADLIRSLLAFARQQPLRPQRTDVNQLVRRTAKLLGGTLGGDISLTLDLENGLSAVVADPAQLEAALINLSNNARGAMPAGGRLRISTKAGELDNAFSSLHPEVNLGLHVLIEVSDSGTGIASETISNIFEPFFTTKATGEASGLGLSMVFGFVTQSGGHLAVLSELGQGSTFRIYLPCAPFAAAAAPVLVDQAPVVGGDEIVLVVEDYAPLRRATSQQLSELGYHVREAEHAEEALMILASEDRVDLLFTDLVMPGTMDGLDLANLAVQARRGLSVLLTSGLPGVRAADQRMVDCGFHLLDKPYGPEELARSVRRALGTDDLQRRTVG